MEVSFTQRLLRGDVVLHDRERKEIHLKKGDNVFVHTLNGEILTYYTQGLLLRIEMVTILIGNQFFGIQKYKLKPDD